MLLPADLGERPIDRAIRSAYDADRLGLAFVAGYSGALRALVPDAPLKTSLCATEAGGAHPRAIATRLAPREGGGYSVKIGRAHV